MNSDSQLINTGPSKRRGLMVIISAPSGTGKTTLSKLIMKHDKHIHMSISVTTREKRPNEVENVDYIFVTREKFKKMLDNNEFLEYAEVFGNFYGTLRSQVESFIENGEDVLFDIDWQGHRQLTAKARDDVASVFILPPSKDELLKRLMMRGQDSPDVMKTRMEELNLELNHWHEYDYVIINRDVNETLEKLLAILHSERLKKSRRLGLPQFVMQLMQETLNEKFE